MTKDQILSEIRRTARANGNVPLGCRQFQIATGIQEGDWRGKHWARWSDAVRDAGFSPNTLQGQLDEISILEQYISLAREIGHLPVRYECQLKTESDSVFPNWCTFSRRYRGKAGLVARLLGYCSDKGGYDDIVRLCSSYMQSHRQSQAKELEGLPKEERLGYVYLIKHGKRREYKIGRTVDPMRREGEIALQVPERVSPVHYIKTDDPSGIEAYWHNRFAAKRKEGEWFELSDSDVKAFKRWKRIY